MAKRQTRGDLRRWAAVGAEHRLRQISEEAARILRLFPELLGRGFTGKGGWGAHIPLPATSSRKRGRPKTRRRTMSADARRRISEAQKARWAKQKARSAGAAKPGGPKKR